MGAAVPQFSTLTPLSDCTLGIKTTSKKANLAQSFRESQTLAAPRFITIQQLICLRTSRKSFVKVLMSVAADRAPPVFGFYT